MTVVIVIGAVMTLTGIVRGNLVADQIWNEMKEKSEAEHDIFSTGEMIGSGSIQGKRSDAIKRYRTEQPNGIKLQALRTGQLLTGIGMLVVIVGFFI